MKPDLLLAEGKTELRRVRSPRAGCCGKIGRVRAVDLVVHLRWRWISYCFSGVNVRAAVHTIHIHSEARRTVACLEDIRRRDGQWIGHSNGSCGQRDILMSVH